MIQLKAIYHQTGRLTAVIFISGLLLLLGCGKIDVFEKTTTIPEHQWKASFKPSFSFDIEDTSQLYKAYITVRHSDAYKYQNLYVKVSHRLPGSDSTISGMVNIQLADNSRGWFGSGMDDIWTYRFPLNTVPARLSKGIHTFTIEQVMRDNPLQHIMNIGIRVEKAP
jgi:gliding motility-associated lipoprotein GldH